MASNCLQFIKSSVAEPSPGSFYGSGSGYTDPASAMDLVPAPGVKMAYRMFVQICIHLKISTGNLVQSYTSHILQSKIKDFKITCLMRFFKFNVLFQHFNFLNGAGDAFKFWLRLH